MSVWRSGSWRTLANALELFAVHRFLTHSPSLPLLLFMRSVGRHFRHSWTIPKLGIEVMLAPGDSRGVRVLVL